MFQCISGHPQNEFSIYMVTFDSSVTLDNNFWTTVCEQFMAQDHDRFYFDKTFPANGSTFKGFFSKRVSAKRSILIIDEASRITSVGDVPNTNMAITNKFINVIRSLRDDYNYNLHAVLLVGTESVRELLTVHNTAARTSQISPFSTSGAFKMVRFSQSEVYELFSKFQAKFSGFEFAAIAADVFELTIGHKGLVGCCGVFIERSYNIDNSPIKTIKEWKSKTTDKLR
ncbi:ATP-dependent RNA helicase, partial [Entomortierella beljakovae]